MKQKNKIPKGWVESKLIQCVDINKETLSDKNNKNIKFYYIDLSSVDKGTINLPLNKIDFIDAPVRARRIINKDDILFSTVRPYLKGFAYISFETNKEWIVSTGFAVLTAKKNIISKYVYQYLFLDKFLKQIETCLLGSSYPALNSSDIENLIITYPINAKEQEKIVEILELWDKAIETTKKLIEQKKLQKKYLMQKLLTGKIRLKGFKDKWIKTNLGKISIMQSGGTPSTKKQEYFDGNILWASVSDMSSSKKYIDSTEKTISEKGLKNSNAKLFPKGTILFAMYASIGEVCITKVPMTTSQAILSICCSDQLYNEYLYYYLLLYKKIFISLGQTGTQSNLNKGMVENIVLHLPKYNEQKAIANILSTADNQINLLEQKLSKLELEKKGLMQKLLTGQIRV